MTMIKTGDSKIPKKDTGTPWPSKVLKFDAGANNWKNQPTPQPEKCACGALMVKDEEGTYCPNCKEKEGSR